MKFFSMMGPNEFLVSFYHCRDGMKADTINITTGAVSFTQVFTDGVVLSATERARNHWKYLRKRGYRPTL